MWAWLNYPYWLGGGEEQEEGLLRLVVPEVEGEVPPLMTV